MAKLKLDRSDLAFALFALFMAGFIAGTTFAPQAAPRTFSPSIGEERVVQMILPAVDNEGKGVAALLYTSVKPGTGKILLDSSDVLNYIDTQLSSRIAAQVAAKQAKVDLGSLDVIYTIKVNASIIEGPSAGASMAISVLLALENKTADGVAITGTISPDGTIGPVGAVPEKARAARDYGSSVFLIPKGQLISEESKRIRTCSLVGSFRVCRIAYKPETVDISKALNMTVYEVANIAEAYSYFNTTV